MDQILVHLEGSGERRTVLNNGACHPLFIPLGTLPNPGRRHTIPCEPTVTVLGEKSRIPIRERLSCPSRATPLHGTRAPLCPVPLPVRR